MELEIKCQSIVLLPNIYAMMFKQGKLIYPFPSIFVRRLLSRRDGRLLARQQVQFCCEEPLFCYLHSAGGRIEMIDQFEDLLLTLIFRYQSEQALADLPVNG